MQDLQLELDRLWFGPWGAQAQGVSLHYPGLKIEVDELTIDLALWSSLTGLTLDIVSASATRIDVSLDPDALPESSDEAIPDTPFEGLAPLLRLPSWIQVRELLADGRIKLRPSAQTSIAGPVKLALTGLGPGRQASLKFGGTVEAVREANALAALQLTGDISAAIAANGTIPTASATLLATPTLAASAGRFAQGQLKLDLGGKQESWSLQLDGAVQQRMFELVAHYDPAIRQIAAHWNASINPGMVAAFMHQDISADISGNSSGHGLVDLARSAISLNSITYLRGVGWESFDPRLARWDDLTLDADVQFAGWGERWRADQFDLVVATAHGGDVLRVNTLQKTDWDLAGPSMVPERWGAPAMRIEVDELPLAWLSEFDPARIFKGGLLSGAVDLVAVKHRHIRLDVWEPVRATGVELAPGPQGPLPPLDLEILPHARIETGELEASVERLTVRSARGLEVTFQGHADSTIDDWPVIDFAGDVIVRAPHLRRHIRGLDGFKGKAALQLDLERQVLGIHSARIGAKSMSGAVLMDLELEGEGPLELTIPQGIPDWDNFNAQHLALRLQGFPVDWLDLYLPEIDLQSGYAYGELHAVSHAGRDFRLEAPKPFEIRGLVPFYRGVRMSRGTVASLLPSASLRTDGGEFLIDAISVRNSRGDKLDGRIRLDWHRANSERIALELGLEGWFPSLTGRIGQLGALRWNQRGHINRLTGKTDIEQLELSVSDASEARILEISSLRPFSIATEPLAFSADKGARRVLQASIRPLELERLIPKLGELSLQGVLPEGEFFGHVDGAGRLVLAAEEPLLFHDVNALWDDVPLLLDLDVGLKYEVAYSAS